MSPTLARFNNLWQTLKAAQLGRTEIIAHGTAINPQWYVKQPYFPHTPSLGCLCSPEIWNGILIRSVQQQWVDVVQSNTNAQGYLVVAEIADFDSQYGQLR